MAESHVRLVSVSKRFGANPPAVDDISLDVPRGSFTTFLGPSGCGKTTTLRMIAGFYEPDSGDILLGDRRINDLPAHRRQTAMVFQDYALFPHMSVFDNVAYGLKLARLPREEIRSQVAETLGYLGLTNLENRSPNQLSGGQQQRVALARALVMKPQVLLLDEPLSNLDAKLRVSIRNELVSIQRELRLTTIYVTHDQEEALAMSDWIAVMDRGRIVQWGSPWEIYYKPRNRFLADFVGAVNLVEVRAVTLQDGFATVELGDQRFRVSAGLHADSGSGRALLCVRPETITICAAPTADSTSVQMRGRVARQSFLGHLMRYWVLVDGQEWIVDRPDPGATTPFENAVCLEFSPERAYLVSEE